MEFVELTIHTTAEASELIADILWHYTNYGVAISDVNDVIALQRDKSIYWDYMDDSLKAGGETLVKAFITKDNAQSTIKQINEEIAECVKRGSPFVKFGTLEITKRIVDGNDWIEIWRKHFVPIHIGERLVICPEWVNYKPSSGERVVKLDNNMAFGTGEHETTSMCLKLLQQYITPSSVCVDVGCGSGILGISAIKLGAREAYLTDIDEIAVQSAKHNCKINGVEGYVKVVRSDLLSGAYIKGDIVLANITGEILVRLAPEIKNYMHRTGVVILSGIIESRLKAVKQAFSDQQLKLERQVKNGEWFALVFRL